MFRDSRKFTLQGYNRARNLLKLLFIKLHSNIWPEYQTQTEFQLAHDGFLHVPLPQLKVFLTEINKTPPKQVKATFRILRSRILNRSMYRSGSALSLLGDISQGSGEEDIEEENEAPYTKSLNLDASFLQQRKIEKLRPETFKLQEKKIEDDCSVQPEQDDEFNDYSDKAFQRSILLGIGLCESVVHNSKLKLSWQDIKGGLQIEVEDVEIPSRVVRALAFEQSQTLQGSEAVVQNYKKFLILRALVLDTVEVVPSPLILRAWALHAAESRSYIKYCRQIFGSIIPLSHSSNKNSDYQQTLKLFQHVFSIQLDQNIWPETFEAQNCHILYDIVGIIREAMGERSETLSHTKNDKFEEELIKQAIAPMAPNQI